MRFLFMTASEPAALALARVLASEGHVVHAVDVERFWGTAPARYSRAYTHFYRINTLFDIVETWHTIHDEIDMVIPFSRLPTHVRGRLVDMGANVLGRPLFENDTAFQDFIRNNVISRASTHPSVVKVPTSFTIHSRAEIAEILGHYPTATFALRSEPVFDFDDKDTLVGLDSPTASSASMDFCAEEPPLIISYDTLSDSVVESIKELHISETRSCKMVEVVGGGAEYSAHAFAKDGKIRTFIVSAKRGASGDVVVIPSTQPLFDIFYRFTKQFIEALDDAYCDDMLQYHHIKNKRGFTDHISLHFRVNDEIRENGDFIRKVTATHCTNDPHYSLAILCATPSNQRQLAQVYAQTPSSDEHIPPALFPPSDTPWGLYSAPAAAKVLRNLTTRFAPLDRAWRTRLSRLIIMGCVKVLCFQEEMWSWWDPGPAFCLWVGLLAEYIGKSQWVRVAREWLLSVGR
jgi:hypothetical protein